MKIDVRFELSNGHVWCSCCGQDVPPLVPIIVVEGVTEPKPERERGLRVTRLDHHIAWLTTAQPGEVMPFVVHQPYARALH